jgi:transposase
MLPRKPVTEQDGLRRRDTPLLQASRRIFPFIQRVFADSGYAGEKVAKATLIAVEIVRKNPGQVGFAVNPRRWVVERFFARIGRNRRLAKDFEATIGSARAFLYAASVNVARASDRSCFMTFETDSETRRCFATVRNGKNHTAGRERFGSQKLEQHEALSGPEMSTSYPTFIDPKLDVMASVMTGKASCGADVRSSNGRAQACRESTRRTRFRNNFKH